MLSIIICSRNIQISNILAENLRETIVANYELVIIDNSKKQFSIFEAYNQGIKRSNGDILIFLHDDVVFHTPAWGKKIEKIFEENPEMGLLGNAGSSVKTKMPSTWWTGPGKNYVHIIQHHKEHLPARHKNEGFGHKNLVEVAVIDGVFMAMKANPKIQFSENIEGYHTYDLDLSLQHFSLGKKIYVTNEILIEHFSGGKINKEWYISTSQFHKNNMRNLPIACQPQIQEKLMKNAEFSSGAEFINGLLKNKFYGEAFYWWVKLICLKPFSKFHLKFLLEILRSYREGKQRKFSENLNG